MQRWRSKDGLRHPAGNASDIPSNLQNMVRRIIISSNSSAKIDCIGMNTPVSFVKTEVPLFKSKDDQSNSFGIRALAAFSGFCFSGHFQLSADNFFWKRVL
jgi:hypothetical protein